MPTATIATRGSKLAVAQTNIVAGLLKQAHPNLDIRLKTITTSGDRDTKTTLWNLPTPGFFTTQVEDALLENTADIAVHSLKDLPVDSRPNLHIPAVCPRQYPADCVVAAPNVKTLADLKPNARIGTSSLRRTAQLRAINPSFRIEPIRGNVETRVKAIDRGTYDAVVLAQAGLHRLDLADRISIPLDPEQFAPAPAQGALAVQTRTDNEHITQLVAAINHRPTQLETAAERHILKRTGGGCHAPLAAFARVQNDHIHILALIAHPKGTQIIRKSKTAPADDYLKAAAQLADELLNAGGAEILKQLENQK